MAGPGREYIQEETINILRETAAAKADNFRTKLWRYENLSGQPVQIATFAEAMVQHVTNPELWVPQFAGGGRYAFSVYHVTDPNIHLGGFLKFQIDGEPRQLDLNVPFVAGWQGPKALEYPKRPQPQQFNTVASPSNPAGTLPQTNVPGGGGGAVTLTGQQASDSGVAKALGDLQTKIEAYSQSKAALDDEKRRLELERIRHENEMRMRELELKVVKAQADATSARPVEHSGSALKEIIAVLAPVLQTVLQSQAETRNTMLKLDAERAARDAEDRRRSETMMIELFKRPAVDPVVLALLEKSRDSSAPQAEMVAQMAGAMGNVAEVTMQVVSQAAEMANGGQEHWGLTAAKEVAKGLGALVQGMKPPAALKPRAPALPAPASGFAGLPGSGASGNGAVAAQNFQPPAPGVAGVQQAPVQPPAGQQPQTVMQQLVAAIKAYVPPHAVADAVIRSLNEPTFSAELDAVNGSMQELATKYLSDWLPTDPRNMVYMKALFDEIQKQGTAAGVFEDPQAQQAAQADEGDEEEDEESDQDSA